MNFDIHRYAEDLWEITLELSPWLFMGFLLAGVIDFIFPEKSVKKWLGKNKKSSVFIAALMGAPLPLCSCGVVPAALALRRRGASKGATVSFLVTTPQSGIDSISATWGMMGAPFALLRTLFTLITGLLAGLTVSTICDSQNEHVINADDASTTEPPQNMLWRFLKPGWDILESIYMSLIVGLLLAALISSQIILDQIIDHSLMQGFVGMLLLAAIGLPLYVCATASIPLAMAFAHQGFSPGAVFVFLLVGPATNLATALIVKKEIGTKAFLTYILSIFSVGILAGYLINLSGVNIIHTHGHEGHNHSEGFSLLHELCAILLSALLVFLILKRFIRPKKKENVMGTYSVKVDGMTCEHCRKTVVKAVEALDGTSDVNVDLKEGTVSLQGSDEASVKDAVVKAGFEAP